MGCYSSKDLGLDQEHDEDDVPQNNQDKTTTVEGEDAPVTTEPENSNVVRSIGTAKDATSDSTTTTQYVSPHVIECDQRWISHVIGHSGSTLIGLEADSDTTITVSRDSEGQVVPITIEGQPEDIAKAVPLVM